MLSAGNKRVLKFDCKNCGEKPSLSSTPSCMKDVIENLEKNANVDKILLDGEYVEEYREKDLSVLQEYVEALKNSKYLALKTLTPDTCTDCEDEREEKIRKIWSEAKSKPAQAKGKLKQLKKKLEESSRRGPEKCKECREHFLKEGIMPAIDILSDTKIMEKIEEGNGKADRLKELFSPTSRPSFLRSKLKLKTPKETELVEAYRIGETKIRIYHSPEELEYIYFILPPEYDLPPKHVRVIQDVKRQLLETQGNLNPDLARKEIRKKSKSLIMETALERGIDLEEKRIEGLSKSLAKFTAGLGIIETLLSDDKIQDIYVDAPVGNNPVYIYHQEFEECTSNIFMTPEDAQVLTSRFRAISGRPFSEANPTLDLNLGKVRVAAIQEPLSPDGLAMAIRRHKSTPWTLPLFISKNFLTPKAGGLLSLAVDSQASILITGSRGAGKTSLLGALMLELLPKYRILCLEDTAELPIKEMKSLGYKAQRLQIRPSSSGSELEMEAENALRSALRLGESVLVMGEVRGPETKSLYEAMRVGAAGNSVMGTIHGSSTKDVFERVVYDLGIPPSSFKATDLIAVASPIRVGGSIKRKRRLTQVSEVEKEWQEDPLKEDGFTDLLSHDPEEDKLSVTDSLKENESHLLDSIAEKWSMSVRELKKNLDLRTRIQKKLVEKASSTGNSRLLEAERVVESNLTFHRLLEEELDKGRINYSRVFSRWKDWLGEVTKR